jgi:hypothetical protein
MTLHEILKAQFEKAQKEFEKSMEIQDLNNQHAEINKQIRDKNLAAIEKLENGHDVSDEEQEAIRKLGLKQEEIFRKLSDKILNK